jgi:hypothetical protein
MHTEFLSENLKERDHLKDLGIDGMVIIESILEKDPGQLSWYDD